MQELESKAAAAQGDNFSSAKPSVRRVVDPELSEDVRQLMRKVPASVAVVTVAHVDPNINESVAMGIAVSSLSTVTLDPPTISFNVKQPSQALDAIRQADGRFRVHWLNANTNGRSIVEHFCNGNNPKAYGQRRKNLNIRLPHLKHGSTVTALSAPRIGGHGVRAAAACLMTQELEVGDHVILVAQVKGLELVEKDVPTITYVDGTYRSLSNKGVLGQHPSQQTADQPAAQQQDVAALSGEEPVTEEEIKATLNRAHELKIAYDWPTIPGEAERSEYAERLASYIKDTQGALGSREIRPKTLIKCLQPDTQQLASSLGVHLVALVIDCLKKEDLRDKQVLPDFYGRLTPAKMAKLHSRMTQLVKADEKFLDVGYIPLLHYLGVLVGGTAVLPSDLLNPLRAEGLLPPFEPSPFRKQDVHNGNILLVEQAEHVIRSGFSQLTDSEKITTTLPLLLRRANLSAACGLHFADSFVDLKFGKDKALSQDHDIAGEVTPEEARVVISRLVEDLGVDNEQVYRARMIQDSYTALRHIGVHPVITGLNVDFVISKIRYLHSTVEKFSDLRHKVEEFLQPYFASKVTWEDLERRIKEFVQKLPLRAATWNSKDALAAMGLSGRTLISTSITETPNTIDESNLFDMLMAKALKDHYGDSTDEEKQAIATCLKDRHGIDVTHQPVTATPEEARKRSSADDLDAAMSQYEADTIPIRIRPVK